ncbi:MAG: dihydrofolate reductase family protein [Alicyclobacillus sp.]|nr:dihydrofolate reductase family protein [Alicyclobacillus sp.]
MLGRRKLVFYGAVSLDGYLARKDGALDWLFATEGEEDMGYADFYATVDTVLMGRKTYDQILINSPDRFPYKGKECCVFSRTLTGTTSAVQFVNDDIVEFTRWLKSREGKSIWMVGGGEALHPLIRAQLVDEFIIQIAPSIIGRGIPLFLPGDVNFRLLLVDVKRYKQFAELHYVTRSERDGQ